MALLNNIFHMLTLILKIMDNKKDNIILLKSL